MPEYLAPGVYVEETSFRAKSIEGVSTSTTGFVGPTRTGPTDGTPELITSFGNFERIYGGLEDLVLGGTATPNYLAHAVRAYFDNGGGRLYVARVYGGAGGIGEAATVTVGEGEDAETVATFVARFPGQSGAGRIDLREVVAPAFKSTLEAAPRGTLVRIGGSSPPRPARVVGGAGPFTLDDGDQLLLTVDGDDEAVTFSGRAAEAFSNAPLPDPVLLDDPGADTALTVTLGGVSQEIQLPAEQLTPQALAAFLNEQLRGGFARLSDGDDDGPAGRLVLGTDRRGTGATLQVSANETLGLDAASVSNAAATDDNNVADLAAVTAAEISALLEADDIGARAGTEPGTGNLVLTTTSTGDDSTLAVREGATSAHEVLGLAAGAGTPGSEGVEVQLFEKGDEGFRNADNQEIDGYDALPPDQAPNGGADILTLALDLVDGDGRVRSYENVGLGRAHPRFLGRLLPPEPQRRTEALENPYAVTVADDVNALTLHRGLFGDAVGGTRTVTLVAGDDGPTPNADRMAAGLERLARLDDISIVAAPGSSAYPDAAGIALALQTHVEARRTYRIAVVDAPPDRSVGEVRQYRGRFDSTKMAFYDPWVVVSNPLVRPGADSRPPEIALPPSGFVCGIYARTDVERGVHKAPANEVVRGALRFATEVSFGEQEVLNPLGVNCLRSFAGRGQRLWGARTASSDPEWKYVNVRRYFLYLEASIERGTHWVVFEPNGERLWANVRETIGSFLYNEWRSGALLGSTPEEAYFVRCDRSTMTQNDLDNGRLICEIGVAALKPAEFVVFRIGQKTVDARS